VEKTGASLRALSNLEGKKDVSPSAGKGIRGEVIALALKLGRKSMNNRRFAWGKREEGSQ